MSLAEKLLKEFQELPDEKKMEVIDFVQFLKMKEKSDLYKVMDDIINENVESLRELAK
ncbi:MAG: hypothetical protein ACM3KR_11220 [Deltaproteobacteria bacterium]